MGEMKLKDLRKKYKISGVKIAEALNISPQYYYDLEKGKRRLSVDHAKKLANIFHVSLDELLDKDAEIQSDEYDYRIDPKLPIEVKDLLDKLVEKDEKERKKIIEQALIYIAGLESKNKP